MDEELTKTLNEVKEWISKMLMEEVFEMVRDQLQNYKDCILNTPFFEDEAKQADQHQEFMTLEQLASVYEDVPDFLSLDSPESIYAEKIVSIFVDYLEGVLEEE